SDRDWSSDVCSSDLETHVKYGQTLLALGKKKGAIKHLRLGVEANEGRWSDLGRQVLIGMGISPPEVTSQPFQQDEFRTPRMFPRSEERRVGKEGISR